MAVTISLEGRVALVTGGSQGIGEAISRALAEAGALVVVAGRNEERAREAASRLTDRGLKAEPLRLDVADPASVSAGVRGIAERHGRLDILVNNAGVTDDGLILRMSKASWDSVIATDLTGVFLASQEAVRVMLKKKLAGRIVNITSVVGLMGNPGQTNYAAAKAGVLGFTMALAREIGSRGITVNAVAPGYVETAMTAGLNEEQKNALSKEIVLGRLGTPADIAGAVLYLASDAAAYVTGTCLNVSGGLHMG